MATKDKRQFTPISVVPLGRQTFTQRWGETGPEPGQVEVPEVAHWAMNLTAFSQIYNLYFVGYDDKVFFYKPQGPLQIIPREPELILHLMVTNPPEDNSYEVTINHIIVGELGFTEILLCALKNGDVVAFYTKPFWDFASGQSQSLSRVGNIHEAMRPFFHEHVGASVWGLAIHQQSRLIAVSSNLHQIQIFAFGLHRVMNEFTKQEPYGSYCGDSDTQFPVRLISSKHHDQRESNFRIILKLPLAADNIPSIAFASDEKGDAQTIVASDIRGGLWFFRIWEPVWKRLPMYFSYSMRPIEPLGWGVLVLSPSFFKSTSTVLETYGCPQKWISYGRQVDISRCERLIPDYRTLYNPRMRTTTTTIDNEASRGDFRNPGWGFPAIVHHSSTFTSESDEPNTWSPPSDQNARRVVSHSRSLSEFVSPGHAVLYANRHDATLIPSAHDAPPTYFKLILQQDYPHSPDGTLGHLRHHNRLNMLVPIPELSLVVLASQVGRVALLTMTRHTGTKDTCIHADSATFRIDTVLPLDSEDEEKQRPSEPLLGVAVSPIKETKPLNGKAENPRFRMLLHYQDFTILSYILSREDDLGAVSVVDGTELPVSAERVVDEHDDESVSSFESDKISSSPDENPEGSFGEGDDESEVPESGDDEISEVPESEDDEESEVLESEDDEETAII